MRFVVPLLSVASFTILRFVLLAAPESCVLGERDPDGGAESGAPPPPMEAAAADVFGGCTCCGKTILPLLPDCDGKVAFAVPAGDCPKACGTSTAYVLCEGSCYSECACDLPAGVLLVDGGS